MAPNVLLIPGTSSVTHLEENLAVADIELPDELKTKLDALTPLAICARTPAVSHGSRARNHSTSTQSRVRCTAFCQPA